MIEWQRFQDCFLEYHKKFLDAEREYEGRKIELIKACQGLVCHPDTGPSYKSEMLRFIRELESK